MQRLIGFVALGFLALIVGSCVHISRLGHTCIACRLTRVDYTCFGFTRPAYYENECSQWYPSHVEAVHAHVWERGTCRYTCNLLGMPVSFGCWVVQTPFQTLDPSTQMQVYQHFKDPLEAKKLFESLSYEKTRDVRLDAQDEDRRHFTMRAIYQWEAKGFPGTWGEWWDRFPKKDVDENPERLAWPNAGGTMSFEDWQKQKKLTN
jgi:hypothetical protein